jgi:outer membrane murein-binding lipoprotein Lpp
MISPTVIILIAVALCGVSLAGFVNNLRIGKLEDRLDELEEKK